MVVKIAIVGTHQSGSTRLFNLCRLIFETQKERVHSCFEYKHNRDSEFDVIINKTHDTTVHELKQKYDKILLPIRNLLDSAISNKIRFKQQSTINDVKHNCKTNIDLFNKFERIVNYIMYYEKYSMYEVRALCKKLDIELTNIQIVNIMKELDRMHNSKDIVKIDNHADKLYNKTLLSQQHNTSGGISNKFVKTMSVEDICEIINDESIKTFMQNHKYI